jgi:hypothetical protein
MKAHRDLRVTGTADSLGRLMEVLSRSLPEGWVRDGSREKKVRDEIPGSYRPQYCFVSLPTGDTPSAEIWFAGKGDSQLYVSAIVSRGRNMTLEECNALIMEFHDSVLAPEASRAGLHIDVEPEEQGPENWMTTPTAKLLRSFSGIAKGSHSRSHPLDTERWIMFLIAAHRENAEVNATGLAEWLMHEGWGHDAASSLAIEYDLVRDLLKTYDKATPK